MKIGIDLGGSHIAIGVIDNGTIVEKIEHNFLKEEKANLNITIQTFINNKIDKIIENVGVSNISMVGISVPRTS